VTRSLTVWWDTRQVGTLRVNQHGELHFEYLADWLADSSCPAISFSLPKREGPFKQHACRPFFAGLLPEEHQRDAVAKALGVSRGNDFGLLDALGGDVAGALSLLPDGIAPAPPTPDQVPRLLDDSALIGVLDALPTRPLLAGQEGLRLSLAGAQSKLPVVVSDGRVALPASGQPTTHILKPPIARFSGTTENEALAMHLAAACGLPVAPVEARTLGGRSYLLVTRYDRRLGPDGVVSRLHQEDLCQALGIIPEHKYSAEGGPTFKVAFDFVRRATTRPALAILALLDAAIFNVIIGNADAHGKNFSLLYDDGWHLAPFYDLLSTVAYQDLSPTFAMKIGGCGTLEEIASATWPKFAREIGMAAPYVRGRVQALANAAREHVQRVATDLLINASALDGRETRRFVDLITTRAELLATTASGETPSLGFSRRPLRRRIRADK
jgi:serine/threonine-protein kinase HipA